ncbi:MAG TPA: hypothetical protein VMY77_06190 [Chitinophagaceae bacterium]|nr:hypothetical protein [Chitinophagaceae bacterium]
MKKILFRLLLPVCFAFNSCNTNKPKDLVVNKWKIINIDMPDLPLPDSIKASAMRGTIELTKDGKWLVTGMGRDQKGSYTLSEDGKTIFIITNGRTETNQILELTKSKMILFDSVNNSKITVVPR